MTSGKKRFERSDDNWVEDEGSGNKYGCRKLSPGGGSKVVLWTSDNSGEVNNYLSSTY